MKKRDEIMREYTNVAARYDDLAPHLEVLLDIRALLQDNLDALYEIRKNTF